MNLNDITKGVLVCICMLVLMAIAGTVDYRDRMHFSKDKDDMVIYVPDTTESAYDLMRIVSESKDIPQ